MNEVSGQEPRLGRGEVVAGKYRLERELSRGGMGVVWTARHEMLGQFVAIKTLLPDSGSDPIAIERFTREARAAAMLKSDHVVRVFDVGFLPSGLPYIAMEQLDGRDLAEELTSRGPLPLTVACEYMVQALEAIAEAHSLGIVHRDLKLSNLFLAKRANGAERVKVLDFGISKFQGPATGGRDLTSKDDVLGSPAYMSPEQLRDPRSVDTRTDVWSVGIILYELLSGIALFDSDKGIGEIFAKVLNDPIPPLRTVRPDVPEEIDRVVMRCLDRNRETRLQTVDELWSVLALFAPPPSTTTPLSFRVIPAPGKPVPGKLASPPTLTSKTDIGRDEPTQPLPSATSRRLLRIVALGGGLFLAIAGVAVALRMLRHASPQTAQAASAPLQPAASSSAPSTAPPAASAIASPLESTSSVVPSPVPPPRAASTPGATKPRVGMLPPPPRSPAPKSSSGIAAPLRGRE
jgi:serine/threonine protein kinase